MTPPHILSGPVSDPGRQWVWTESELEVELDILGVEPGLLFRVDIPFFLDN